jgi:hypothetical protein
MGGCCPTFNRGDRTRYTASDETIRSQVALGGNTFIRHVTLDRSIPISDCDPYTDEVLASPWEMHRELRALGSAVWLRKYAMFALTRYDSVERA